MLFLRSTRGSSDTSAKLHTGQSWVPGFWKFIASLWSIDSFPCVHVLVFLACVWPLVSARFFGLCFWIVRYADRCFWFLIMCLFFDYNFAHVLDYMLCVFYIKLCKWILHLLPRVLHYITKTAASQSSITHNLPSSAYMTSHISLTG